MLTAVLASSRGRSGCAGGAGRRARLPLRCTPIGITMHPSVCFVKARRPRGPKNSARAAQGSE
ncbi:hypothetical protein SFR_6150 [Streptomyces sp. FR-008]|nr:hypothetical protein SFR_6150 [Streptomyces sp. FR-008]